MNDLKVLVVDDESRMRKLVRDFLVKDGYSVVEAADGEEAVDVFMSDKDISLIILDVMMPKLDGYGVAEEVRKMSDVPIIMLTAKSDERDELRGFDLGIDEYITKPFSPRILVARVASQNAGRCRFKCDQRRWNRDGYCSPSGKGGWGTNRTFL